MSALPDVHGKVAVVTGGASGIGDRHGPDGPHQQGVRLSDKHRLWWRDPRLHRAHMTTFFLVTRRVRLRAVKTGVGLAPAR
jgi:hypothetical protein